MGSGWGWGAEFLVLVEGWEAALNPTNPTHESCREAEKHMKQKHEHCVFWWAKMTGPALAPCFGGEFSTASWRAVRHDTLTFETLCGLIIAPFWVLETST